MNIVKKLCLLLILWMVYLLLVWNFSMCVSMQEFFILLSSLLDSSWVFFEYLLWLLLYSKVYFEFVWISLVYKVICYFHPLLTILMIPWIVSPLYLLAFLSQYVSFWIDMILWEVCLLLVCTFSRDVHHVRALHPTLFIALLFLILFLTPSVTLALCLRCVYLCLKGLFNLYF